MFGHQNDDSQPDETAQVADAQPTDTQATTPIDDAQSTTAPYLAGAPSWQHPGPPPTEGEQPSGAPPTTPSGDVISPAGGFPKPLDYEAFKNEPPKPEEPAEEPEEPKTEAPEAAAAAAPSDDILDVSSNQLIEIKQQALSELSPLIDQLDQSPEERFKTVMMLIQASDNQELVKKAYEAAHGISDEKVRAQALLDIVNEINYFTTPHN